MGYIQVYDFGETEGVRMYRVNGKKNDLQAVLDECRKLDAQFESSPEIIISRKDQWTMLLKIKVAIKVGGEG